MGKEYLIIWQWNFPFIDYLPTTFSQRKQKCGHITSKPKQAAYMERKIHNW